ncbi:MAG: 5'-nucleotidase C-terminal domain-containing protein [Caldilineales bacterium]|nr:5'-nucleotidase C-terminal domain-containing protein [Caldilineales bacterium]
MRSTHLPRRLTIAMSLILVTLIAIGGMAAVGAQGEAPAIHDIQGASHLSPMVDTDVSGVHGIVTATTRNGFWMQTPDAEADGDVATSEGIFVFTGSSPAAQVGDEVMVSGEVQEYYPGGYGTGNLSTTELGNATVEVVSSGNALPSATVIGNGGRVPPNMVIDNNSTGDVNAKSPFDAVNEGIDFWESLEGMMVQINEAVAVGPTSNFGEIPVVGDKGANATSWTARGGLVVKQAPGDPAAGYVRGGDFNPEQVSVDDTLISSEPKVNVGDGFGSPIIGVMDYSFGRPKLFNTVAMTDVVPGGLAKETASPSAVTDLRVATFNVENLSANSSSSKFAGLADIIVNSLGSPDIIGLEEIQDNSGPTDDGVVDGGRTYLTLINAITAAGGPSYTFREIAPVNNQDGGAPGANIRVGFLYQPNRVTFVDRPGGSATMGTSVMPGSGGPELKYNPGRVDPGNPAWAEDADTGFEGARKSLAGEFLFNGRKVFVIVNHFKSKSGDTPLFGRPQPPVFVTETQRSAQAEVINGFVQDILAVDPNANVIVLGDFNDFEFTAPMQTLKGAELTNLIETLPANERYTYNFEGNSQTLDHILVSSQLLNNLTGVDVVHVNSEFSASGRSSDHDPVLATFDFAYPTYQVPADATRFRGYVRMGSPSAAGKGVAGVKVHVYGRNNGDPRPGTLIQTRMSDGSGFYNLYILPDAKYTYDFYQVMAETPAGLIGTGIVSEDGFVLDVDPATIEHFQPSSPANVVHLNDIYYDYPPELTCELTILHNNDGESKLVNVDSTLPDFGGIARFATLVQNLKDEAVNGPAALQEGTMKDWLMVTSGDNFLAGPAFNASLEKGVPYYDSIALHYIGYDALDLGNHDFDFGPDVTADFIEGFFVDLPAAQSHVQGPVFLSSNLDVSGEPRLKALADDGKLLPSALFEKCGQTVGIIGLTTPALPYISSPRNVEVDDNVLGAVEREVAALQREGAEIIILISHLQSVEEDLDLVTQLADIDVVIAGGGDETLGDPGDLYVPGDEANIYGPYPLYSTDRTGKMVPVVTTTGDYRYVGRLVVGFDGEGNLAMVEDNLSKMVRVAGGSNPDAVDSDPYLQANVVDPIVAYNDDLANTIIGQSEVALDGARPNIRIKETNEGNLMADALLWQAAQLADSFGLPTPDVAMQNGGGIRNNSVIPAGDITELTTFEIAPFSNFVSISEGVSASDLKAILENAYSRIENVDGRFAHIAGMAVVLDTTQPAGSRVQQVVLADGTMVVKGGEVQDIGRDIVVASIDFLARGGDQYPHLDDFTTLGVSYQKALSNYIKNALGGQITASQYPEDGAGRISINPEASFVLTVLHNNDGESQLINAGSGIEDFGGVARFATLWKELEAEAAPEEGGMPGGVLKVSAGDNFLAGPEWNASLEKSVPYYDAIAQDYLGYDVIDLGNHDFDFGPDITANFIESFEPGGEVFVAANLDFSQEPRMQALVDDGRLLPSALVEKGGRMIGVIGLVPPELESISSPRDVQVLPDTAAVIQSEIDRLTAAGADIIVLATQLQSIQNDLAYAAQVSGLDLVVSGGGDEVLGDPGDLYVPGDEANIIGAYPMWALGKDGAPVPVVTTTGDYKYVGQFKAGFDANGRLVMVDEAASHMVRVAGGANPDAVEPDAYVQTNVVDPVSAYVAGLGSNVIGQSEVNLEGRRPQIRVQETNEGNLMADALLWQAQQQADDFGAPMPEVGMQNGGGIRNNNVIPAGDITELTTFDIAPFSNWVTVVPDVTPQQFKELLENGYSQIEIVGGRFTHIAGVTVVADLSKTAMVIDNDGNIVTQGERVQSAVLADGTVMIENGVIAPTARNVSIATIDFLARGGDQYPFPDGYIRMGASYQQALSNYIKDGLGGQITAAQYPEGGEGRITLIQP